MAYQGLLSARGIAIDSANDGLEAIQMIKTKHEREKTSFKLILMDYSMPECDGPEATKAIIDYLVTRDV